MLAITRGMPSPNPALVEVFDLLRQRGYEVEIGIGDEAVLDPDHLRVEHDLYILKSHTSLWLSVASILHRQGALILNPYRSCLAVQDKIAAAHSLREAGVPSPPYWVTVNTRLLHTLLELHPLVIKPYIGGRGIGVQVIRHHHELSALPPPAQPMLVQEYIAGDELKIYVVGDEVFGLRKPDGVTRVATPVSAEIRSIALRCGHIFGLGLYGLDVIKSAQGPVVIDVNYFPSYKGIPGAARHVANYIENYARGDTLLGKDADAVAHGLLGASPAETWPPYATYPLAPLHDLMEQHESEWDA
jgi:ribosomal protein S6--L-glutamate ligase